MVFTCNSMPMTNGDPPAKPCPRPTVDDPQTGTKTQVDDSTPGEG